jgi:hypothetical protein
VSRLYIPAMCRRVLASGHSNLLKQQIIYTFNDAPGHRYR